jgi:hypothetical protein
VWEPALFIALSLHDPYGILSGKENDMTAEDITKLANNDELLEVARKAVEDVLIELRDARISLLFRGNGLVIREADGGESYVIRLGTEDAMRIGLEAIAKHLG